LQPNSIYDEEDGYAKFIARWYIRSLISDHVAAIFEEGPFILMHRDLTPQNILIDDDYNICGIVDWEWSTTVPFQLFAMPPTALHPYKIPTPAELQGEEKEMFIGHVDEYLDIFQECERSKDADCPIWRVMYENWTSGRYWYLSALFNLWDVDYPFWEYVFPRIYPGRSEQSVIDEFKADSKHADMGALVQKKVDDLKWYEEQINQMNRNEGE
jgi:serine/threonine protein kinase